MLDILKKYKNIRNYYLLAIACIAIDVILGSTLLKGINMLDISTTGGGIGLPIILIIIITIAVFNVPNTKNRTWQWFKTWLIIIIPFGFVFYLFFFDIIAASTSLMAPIDSILYELLSVLSMVFTLKARKYYIKTDEFAIKQNDKIKKREKNEQELAKYRVEKRMKKEKQEKDKENEEEKLWRIKQDDLIDRGLKYYRVGFGHNKKWYGGRREILIYVEAIDKDSAISEARKRLSPELKKQSITECVVIAGQKNLIYDEIKQKWKERNYLGSYATRG